jgi:transcriptional regulator GlxA family with amidase domain
MTGRLVATLLLLFTLPALADSKRYTKNVAILIYDGVEILDFAGPAEVFKMAASFGASDQQDAFNVYTVASTKKPIVSQGFIDVIPDYSVAEAPAADIIVLPGGSGEVRKDQAVMNWIKTAGQSSEHILTVCTGAFLAGEAGFLEGIEATTYYRAVPGLARRFQNTKVHPGRRFVDNGKMITTAGVSAGIDGSLHLVARLLGRYVADRTAEYMEYKWSPESYQSSTYTLLNPQLDDRGRTLQQAAIFRGEGNHGSAIKMYKTLIAENASDAEAWLNLARSLHSEKRYDEAIRANLEAIKGEAQRGNALFNLACAYALTGQREKAIESAAKAIDAGYKIRWLYESDSDLDSIREDSRFKVLLTKL